MKEQLKLLVIDDDDVDRLQLKRALKSSGFEYTLTEYEDTALASIADFLCEHPFDCIFLDYLLPGNTGLSVLKKIREKGVRIPIVMITSQGNEGIAVELMKAGASDYIVKNSINGPALGQVLRNMIRMSRVEREREDAENALRISEARLAEAQRIAKVGNWEFQIKSKDGYCSLELYNVFGVHPHSFASALEDFQRRIHPEDRHLILSTASNALRGASFNIDFRIVTDNGIKYANAQGYTALDVNQVPEKLVGTLQDITERKLSEQEIHKARELAENSMKVKEVFLANMSHEIRTPMNAILGFTRLLYETELSNEQKSFIDAIHFSGENLLVIINDILDLSKIGSGKLKMEKCEFQLNELVSGIIAILKPKAQEKGLQLTAKIDAAVPPFVKGDPVRLNQILVNLINNAIKFTEKGGIYVEVKSTGTTEKESLIEFVVKDTGIGIPDDKRSIIFEDFVQASDDTTRKYGGTGLGLAIVKKIVELHNGKISVESHPGAGSVFTVQLSLERGEGAMASLGNHILPASESLEALRGAFILLVEDNGVNQLLVKKVLAKTGCRIDVASNGLEAIEYLKKSKYDVILMDVQMPEMDGHEATRHIRSRMPLPVSETPIIAMTAHAFGSDVNKCIAVGMNDYISKPFKPEILYSKLIKHLKKPGNSRVMQLTTAKGGYNFEADLTPIHELNKDSAAFLNELILLYDKQTPVIVEKLRGYVKSHNFEAIQSICHQIRASYGILRVVVLDKAVEEIIALLNTEKKDLEVTRIAHLVDVIVSLISAIAEEVKRNLRKTG
jgi:signal transduction histidine kinase/CheY-like chemotaxis protein